jgi:hypothetical protein
LLKSPFEFRGRKLAVGRVDDFEFWMRTRDFLNVLKVIEMIGSDMQGAIVTQSDSDGVEEIGGENAAAMMATFRPGVGEQKVKRFDRVRGQERGYGIGTLDLQDAGVGRRFTSGFFYATDESLDSEKVFFRGLGGEGAEKGAITAAKVYNQRRGPAKERSEIEPNGNGGRGEIKHGKKSCLRRANSTSTQAQLG